MNVEAKKAAQYIAKRLKLIEGDEDGRRAMLFKGTALVKVIQDCTSGEFAAGLSAEAAEAVASTLLRNTEPRLFHRVDVLDAGKRKYTAAQGAAGPFKAAAAYSWDLNERSIWMNVALVGLLIAVPAIMLYSHWPLWLKLGVAYVCIAVSGSILLALALRGIVFGIVWMFGMELWFLPRLFDETIAFTECFTPVVTFKRAGPGGNSVRLLVLVILLGCGYWVYQEQVRVASWMAAAEQFAKDTNSRFLSAAGAEVPEPAADYAKPSAAGAGSAGGDHDDVLNSDHYFDEPDAPIPEVTLDPDDL